MEAKERVTKCCCHDNNQECYCQQSVALHPSRPWRSIARSCGLDFNSTRPDGLRPCYSMTQIRVQQVPTRQVPDELVCPKLVLLATRRRLLFSGTFGQDVFQIFDSQVCACGVDFAGQVESDLLLVLWVGFR